MTRRRTLVSTAVLTATAMLAVGCAKNNSQLTSNGSYVYLAPEAQTFTAANSLAAGDAVAMQLWGSMPIDAYDQPQGGAVYVGVPVE